MESSPAAELRLILERLKQLQEPLKQASLHPANLHWAKFLDNLRTIGTQFETVVAAIDPKLRGYAVYPERIELPSQSGSIDAVLNASEIPDQTPSAPSGLDGEDLIARVRFYNEICDNAVVRVTQVMSRLGFAPHPEADPERTAPRESRSEIFSSIMNGNGENLPVPPELRR